MPRRSQPMHATAPGDQLSRAPAVSGPPGALVALSEAERAAATERFELLKPHLHDGVPLARVAKDAGVPLRSLQRWLARYRAGGLAGLARKARSDQGRRRLPTELVGLIEGLALRTSSRSPPT